MFKVGDVVRIKKDLIKGKSYNGLYYDEEYDKQLGESAVVTYVDSDNTLQVSGADWYFGFDMLEKVGHPQTIGLDFQIFFNDEKKTTVIKKLDGTVKKVTCSKDDVYSRRQGFLEAFFQAFAGVSKDEAHKFLDDLDTK